MTLTWSELCLEYPQLSTQVRGEWVREKTEWWAGWANRAGTPGLGQTGTWAPGSHLRGMSSPWRWWEAGRGEAEET